LGHCP
jgi:Ras-related C3 botulinum toxin substrate 1